MSEKFKKALRIAVNVGCGFEGDAEDAAELLTLITGLESRIAELEAEVAEQKALVQHQHLWQEGEDAKVRNERNTRSV